MGDGMMLDEYDILTRWEIICEEMVQISYA